MYKPLLYLRPTHLCYQGIERESDIAAQEL